MRLKTKAPSKKLLFCCGPIPATIFPCIKKIRYTAASKDEWAFIKLIRYHSYVHFLQENPKEMDILFKELMIGVTNFFRDANVWEKLKETVIPDIIANLPDRFSIAGMDTRMFYRRRGLFIGNSI